MRYLALLHLRFKLQRIVCNFTLKKLSDSNLVGVELWQLLWEPEIQAIAHILQLHI